MHETKMLVVSFGYTWVDLGWGKDACHQGFVRLSLIEREHEHSTFRVKQGAFPCEACHFLPRELDWRDYYADSCAGVRL